MKLYDTLSKQKKELRKTQKELRLFVCGITVYDYAHIGHARTYIFFDMFVKYLRHRGYKIFYLQNITDVDDKIIQRAIESKKKLEEIAKKFEKEYLSDMETLGINSVTKYERATGHIPEIISQVERLLKKGYAYEIENDGIYFDISKFEDYGKLSGRTALQAEDATTRIDDSIAKKNKGDFALWKFSKSEEPQWDSPWGKGRPGWHIEDTAITEKYLGPQYDLHGGGRDLIFPHHEAEIAQMEAITDKKPFVGYWMHTGFLQAKGQKMAKSLKNFVTVRDVLKNYSPQALRLFFITKHYRSPVDYTPDSLKQAQANELKIAHFWTDVLWGKEGDPQNKNAKKEEDKIKILIKNFWEYLDDDFNTPAAFGEFFKLINYFYEINDLAPAPRDLILEFLETVNEIFNIVSVDKITDPGDVPTEILQFASERERMRAEEDWTAADKFRKLIEDKGYIVEDKADGPVIKKRF